MLQLVGSSRKNPLYVAFGLCVTVACGAPESTSDDFGTGEPISLDADVRVIASGQQPVGTTLLTAAPTNPLIADESGVYWYDYLGALFGERRGESAVTTLLAGVESLEAGARLTMSLASSADRLYAGEAYAQDSFDYVSALPPGRVLSIPKDGAAPSVLLESEDEVLVPLAADSERLIVMGLGPEATTSFYQASLANPVLEPIELAAARAVSVDGSTVYWAEHGNLLRAGLDDAEAEPVTRLRADAFWVCPGYFVSRHIGSLDTLFLHDAASGNEQMLPRLVGYVAGVACDAQYVYFYGAARPLGDVEEGLLVRLDVESGEVAHLSSPDLLPQGGIGIGTRIIGADTENIYMTNGDRLLAVRKP